jgi:hypothetical protein
MAFPPSAGRCILSFRVSSVQRKAPVQYIFKKGNVLSPSLQVCNLKTNFDSTEILTVMLINEVLGPCNYFKVLQVFSTRQIN